jgi:hypothetical protein
MSLILNGTTGITSPGGDTSTADDVINGLTVGKGGGAIATNTVVGSGALATATGTSVLTTAIGVNALNLNTAGTRTVAVGAYSLAANTTGDHNVAVGATSLQSNTTGSYNVAMGRDALNANTTASNNTAVGYQAGYTNVTGEQVTYIGSQAGNLSTGSYNTAVGYIALGQGSGSGGYNVAVGRSALQINTTGANNVAVGMQTLQANTTASNNTAVGYQAGYNVTTGANNVFMGSGAGTDAIGNIVTASNYIVLGNNSTANANIKVAWTVVSDIRDKTNFSEIPHGLDFVSNLKPTAYQFRKDRDTEEVAEDSRLRYGFLAQDILVLEGNNSVIIDDRDTEHLKYNESSLIPILVKAIQELNATVVSLQAQVTALTKA